MPRLMPPARSAGNHYRNFAIGVLAVAAIMAVASDGSSGEAQIPARPERGLATDTTPSASPAANSADNAWASDAEAADIAPDIATLPEAAPSMDGDADGAEEKPAGPPKAGKSGPADRPTPEQLAMLISASRERSGAPPDGD